MLIGLVLIIFGYYLVMRNIEELFIWLVYDFFDLILVILVCVILGIWLMVRFGIFYVI